MRIPKHPKQNNKHVNALLLLLLSDFVRLGSVCEAQSAEQVRQAVRAAASSAVAEVRAKTSTPHTSSLREPESTYGGIRRKKRGTKGFYFSLL